MAKKLLGTCNASHHRLNLDTLVQSSTPLGRPRSRSRTSPALTSTAFGASTSFPARPSGPPHPPTHPGSLSIPQTRTPTPSWESCSPRLLLHRHRPHPLPQPLPPCRQPRRLLVGPRVAPGGAGTRGARVRARVSQGYPPVGPRRASCAPTFLPPSCPATPPHPHPHTHPMPTGRLRPHLSTRGPGPGAPSTSAPVSGGSSVTSPGRAARSCDSRAGTQHAHACMCGWRRAAEWEEGGGARDLTRCAVPQRARTPGSLKVPQVPQGPELLLGRACAWGLRPSRCPKPLFRRCLRRCLLAYGCCCAVGPYLAPLLLGPYWAL
jgi:hypothetical protein